MKKTILSLLLLLLFGCARTAPIGPQDDAAASRAWQSYEAISSAWAAKPYRMQLSLRFGEEGDTRRVTAILWGEGERSRLDVTAGVGAVIAKIANSLQEFVLFTPREAKAYRQEGANKPLLRIGTPLPFDLGQLGALLAGNYAGVFGRTHAGVSAMPGGEFAFELAEGPQGTLVLDASGLPTQWRQGPWQLGLTYAENETLPASVKLLNSNGKMAILRVRERDNPQSFTAGQLNLALPAQTEVLPFSQYKAQVN